jgi:hypothetical protein
VRVKNVDGVRYDLCLMNTLPPFHSHYLRVSLVRGANLGESDHRDRTSSEELSIGRECKDMSHIIRSRGL